MTTDAHEISPLVFTPIALPQMERVEAIRRASGSTLYVYTFASLFAWQSFEQYEISFGENAFLVKNGASGEAAICSPAVRGKGRRN